MSQDKMPFTEHLEELRKRLIISAIAIFVGFLICFAFKEKIFQFLMTPWIDALPEGHENQLIYTAPHEAFFTYIKVSLIAGLGIACPVVFYQMWRFIAPGLYENERKYIFPAVFFSSFFFLAGALFGYFFVFPVGFRFFASFASEMITPMVSTKEFLSFSTRLLLGFGVAFELPVVAFFMGKLGLVTSRFLKKQRKFAILGLFFISAILTPPDVISQVMLAGPLLLLYEMSVWIVHFFGKKPVAEEIAQEEKTQASR